MSILSIALDVVVLIGLGITIFYCVRLTKSLNTFRSARQDFGAVMRELSANIDEAYRAVDNLKNTSRDSGQNLQKIINESRTVAHELEVLSQSVAQMATGLDDGSFDAADEDETSFSIFDRESREEDEPEHDTPDFPAGDRTGGGFSSQAERDLYDALQKGRKSTGRGL